MNATRAWLLSSVLTLSALALFAYVAVSWWQTVSTAAPEPVPEYLEAPAPPEPEQPHPPDAEPLPADPESVPDELEEEPEAPEDPEDNGEDSPTLDSAPEPEAAEPSR